MEGNPVILYITNRDADPIKLVLEPEGEIYVVAAGERKIVSYDGDSEPRLSVDVGPAEIKVWAEGPGTLTCENT